MARMSRKGASTRGAPRTGKFETVRKRSRHLEGVMSIESDNYDLLQKFVTDHGKVIPARLTGASAKQQRQIKRAVRRARVMGIIP